MKNKKKKSDITLFNVSQNLSTLQDETRTFIGHHFLLLCVRQTRQTLSKIYNIFRGARFIKIKTVKSVATGLRLFTARKTFFPLSFFFILSLSLFHPRYKIRRVDKYAGRTVFDIVVGVTTHYTTAPYSTTACFYSPSIKINFNIAGEQRSDIDSVSLSLSLSDYRPEIIRHASRFLYRPSRPL